MKRFGLAVFLFLNVLLVGAQEFELGKVTKEELQQKSHPAEPEAAAAVLFEKGSTYFDYNENDGFSMVTETDVRIKIYTKDGYDRANKIVKYYIGQSPTEKVVFSKAVTYNLVNGSIEKTKLKNEGEFDEKVNKFWSQKKITMPNVKEGSVIEYRYSVRSPYFSNFPDWSFQTDIPVNSSEYVTKIPEYYVFQTNLRGTIFPTRTETSQRTTYTYTTKERTGAYVSKTTFSTEALNYMEKIVTYKALNMPSLKDENYVSNIANYTTSIEHELSSTQFPNSPIKYYSTTWDDVVKTIYEHESFGAELQKTGYFEEDVKTLIAGLTSSEEKVAMIFNYVKGRMNWNEYSGYTCDDGVRKAYKDKVGNVAEINLMLTAMLRYAGISANPVLISTRSNGIAFFPNRTAFNYVVCAVETQNAVTLFDATDKFALPNIMPIRAVNWVGRIIRENGSSAEVSLMPKSNSKDVVNLIGTIGADGKVEGKVRDQYFDYNAFVYRGKYSGLTKDSFMENLEKQYAGIEIAEYSTTLDDLSKPVVENYSFSHSSVSEVIGNQIYFSPLLFFTEKENPFKQDKREYPVDFVFPTQDKYALTLTIPDGYLVESMPAPAALSMENELGNFKFNISSSGKQIQISSSVDINQALIAPEHYEMLKNFYKAMLEKQNEKIVLKKA
jgi:transglutaminase-like putative cysteine protease